MSETLKKYRTLQDQISTAAKESARDDDNVTLVAVSKTVEPDIILPILQAGHRHFGENRVQETEVKWPNLRAGFPDVTLHLIGPLQSNKTKSAVALFDVIQTVDRLKIASAIAREAALQGRMPKVFLQINTGEEPQKAGVPPLEADAFIAEVRDQIGLPVIGLMCIPPVDQQPSPHFALLAKIAERNGISGLSMGMSSDYETAIRLGATHVRVGSAIFGARPAQD